jgi:predicted metal-dependent phosphoesterase TrpH
MLSQIGDTLGKGVDISKLGRNIENVSRPDVDPNSVESMQGLLNWQQRMGREDAARTTQAGLSDLRAQQERQAVRDKEEADKQRELNIQKAVVAAKARYQEAVQTGDEAGAAREKMILTRMGEQFGIDSAGITRQVEQDGVQAKLQGMQIEAAENRKAREEAVQKINEQAAAIIDEHGINSSQFNALKQSPMFQQYRDVVQNIETREMQLANARTERNRQVREENTPPDLSFVKSMVTSEKLADVPELQDRFAVLEEKIKGKGDGKWMPAEKAAIAREITLLEQQAARQLNVRESAELAAEQGFQDALNRARSNKVTEIEITNWTEANDKWGFWNSAPSREEAISGILAERENAIREAYGRPAKPDENGIPAKPQDIPQAEWDNMSDEDKRLF